MQCYELLGKIEGEVFCLFVAMPRGGFEGYIADVEGTFEAFGAVKQAFDREELKARIFGAVG